MNLNSTLLTQIMKNFSNFSGQPGSTMEQMQAYITQLTSYIAENNQKYQKNMLTLKEFYQEQLDLIQSQKEDLLNENAAQTNEVVTLRDLLAASQLKAKQNEQLRASVESREQELRERLDGERQRNQQMYEKIGSLKEENQRENQRHRISFSELEQQNRRLGGQLAQKEQQLRSTSQKVVSLQNRLDEHYLLPGKIEDMQRQGLHSDVRMQELVRNHNSMRDQLASKEALVTRLQTENQSLRISKGTFQSDKKRQLELALAQQKEQLEEKIRRLELQNQNLIYQLNQAESRIKLTAQELSSQQERILKQRQEMKFVESQLAATNSQKQQYLSQFGTLKAQYQGVIQRLEDALLGYQKRNWQMEQENKDLNSQLQSLRQLLTEVKAINNIQINRQQYRKLAEMQVAASRPYNNPSVEPKIGEIVQEEKMENDSQWEKLMADIDSIAT